jgi:O-succinylbenzoic acid--CoA ligase
VWLQTLPRFHVGGLAIETRAFLSGAKVISQAVWDASEFIELVQSQRVTLSSLVPTQVFDLIQSGQKAPTSLRAIVIGGAALSEDLYQQAIAVGWPLLPSYGMTECCSQIATASLQSWKTGDRSLKLLSHIQARVMDEKLLEVSSPALLTGFTQVVDGQSHWKDPKLDGWYRSQDLARVEGRTLTPLGRGSDFVKISGEGVDLQKLREILEKIAQNLLPTAWQNLNLAAVPDERRGHSLILQSLQGTEASQVRDLFNQQVAPFERIQEIRTVPELPWKKKNPRSW